MLVHLSTHFSKYFNLFSIFLLYWYIFTFFYIFSVFLKENGKGKGRAATGESVTSHASIRQKPWRAFGG